MSQHCARSGDDLEEWALLFTTWILGIQLRPSELAANTFTHWGSSAVPWIHLRELGIFNSSHTVYEKYLNFCIVSLYEAFIKSCERFLLSPFFAVEPSPLLGVSSGTEDCDGFPVAVHLHPRSVQSSSGVLAVCSPLVLLYCILMALPCFSILPPVLISPHATPVLEWVFLCFPHLEEHV